jgi:type II secretory pathway pseudopilin PulG
VNCKLFAAILHDVARDSGKKDRIAELARKHAEVCLACAGRLAEAEFLTGALRQLASASCPSQASSELESVLVTRFRQAKSPARWRPERRRWKAVALAAVVLIAILGGMVLWKLNGPREAARRSALMPATGSQAARIQTQSLPGQAARRQVPPPNRAEQGNEPDEEASFIPLPYGVGMAPLTEAEVIRVEIPSGALEQAGLPATTTASQPVVADVLIGEDGVPRAIRIVQ